MIEKFKNSKKSLNRDEMKKIQGGNMECTIKCYCNDVFKGYVCTVQGCSCS